MNKNFYDLESKLNKIETESRYAYDCYHTKPHDEAIVTILSNFSKFRFETAISAIWSRHFTVLLCFGLGLLLYSPYILLANIFRFAPKTPKVYESLTKTYFSYCMSKCKCIRSFFIGLGITIIGMAKFIYNVTYLTGWTIIMLLRYIIIPLLRALGGFAIALAMISRNSQSNNR